MDYRRLLKLDDGPPTRAALLGVGQFGRALFAQSRRIPALDLRVLCDLDLGRTRETALGCGVAPEAIQETTTLGAAQDALAAGKLVLTSDPAIAIGVETDVVVESTGAPAPAARNALTAIDAGRHLAMVSKEADVLVGPLLAAKARRAGVVMTLVDGDQPSLALGLVGWARALGFDVICAGKASEHDFVLEDGRVRAEGADLSAPFDLALWDGPDEGLAARISARAESLAALPQRTPPDMCELCLIANASGLAPDRPDLHAPIARTVELPAVFRARAEGGVLSGDGRLDVFNCLRRADEISAAGGVFAVLRAPDAETGALLADKGHPASADGLSFLIYNPQHLLGAEAPLSILAAQRLGLPTGGDGRVRPVCDMTMMATADLSAGTVLQDEGRHHRVNGVEARLTPSVPLAETAPIPFFLAVRRPLARPVAAGAQITVGDVVPPDDAFLHALRAEQDALFH